MNDMAGLAPLAATNSTLRRVPSALSISDVFSGKRVILAGACVLSSWLEEASHLDEKVRVEHLLTSDSLPDRPPFPPEECAFMLASIPRREVSTELAMRLPYADQADHARLFSECVQQLEMLVDQMTRWSDRIPVFMLNFFVPQTNYLGRLLPRYDLRNPAYFTEQLNQRLAEMIAEKNNVYLFDIDSLAASYGRQRVQDDSLWVSAHGSMLDAYDAMYDHDRLEPTLGPLDYFEISTGPFIRLCLSEAFAMYRTLKGVDTVKMACVDLDDTLWRGVMAEREFIDPGVLVSGWPLGFAEALLALKKRGIILAIISKNSEERVRGFWHDLFGERELKLEDFAIVKINWRPKVENIQEAIAEANVLPSSVVFIDDNPVERASVKEAIPEIRVLGAPQYLWRDTLLRSSETQVPSITAESSRRSEMIKAQVAREHSRIKLGREDFLASLEIRVSLRRMSTIDDARLPRALELANKTNQFNTTGRRWSREEVISYFDQGGAWWTFEVADRFTAYGLVGVVSVRADRVDQFVMSCRVLGMEVEIAALAYIAKQMLHTSDAYSVRSAIVETKANLPCRDIFRNAGWRLIGEDWMTERAGDVPAHIALIHLDALPGIRAVTA
jgi:FkbH-like protein